MSAFVTIIGNLGRDAELKYTPNGQSVLNFSVASTRRNRDGKVTDWYSGALWGKFAETMAQYMRKGTKVAVSGELAPRQYEYNGETRTSLDIVVASVELIGGKREEGDAAPDEVADEELIDF